MIIALKGVILYDTKKYQLYIILESINFRLLMKTMYIYAKRCQSYTIHKSHIQW